MPPIAPVRSPCDQLQHELLQPAKTAPLASPLATFMAIYRSRLGLGRASGCAGKSKVHSWRVRRQPVGNDGLSSSNGARKDSWKAGHLITEVAHRWRRPFITGRTTAGRSEGRGGGGSNSESLTAVTSFNKIVILYSSIGHGHIMAARSIQHEIARQDPNAVIVLQDIRAFMPPVHRRMDERLYWFVVNHLPECFESLFWARQETGNRVASITNLPNDYPEDQVLEFLREEAPQTVLATHYGSAQLLGTLRERGLLADVKIGWMHTDFFEGYFPRISKRIDRTFLAHPELEARWIAAGVPTDLVATTGMPVSITPAPQGVRDETLRGCGLDPAVKTILFAGGKDGSGDFQAAAKSIARHVAGPVQIVALCGTNGRNQEALNRLASHLGPRVSLQALGLLPQEEVIEWMRSADVLITKAGGLTPAEAFSIGIPTILMNAVWGHERENADLFVRHGLAEMAADATQAGIKALELMSDAVRQKTMIDAQVDFRNHSDIGQIARFALDASISPRAAPPDLGAEYGQPVRDIAGILARLDTLVPAQVELLLSYSTTKVPERIVLDNPFGHLAISLNGTVFSSNHLAHVSANATLMQHLSLGDYLFGVTPPCGNQEHGSTYGMAYGRDTIGLRVAGVPASVIAAMATEAMRIEEGFQAGDLRWDRRDFNCAHSVVRILASGGFATQSGAGVHGLNTMPLDVFDRALALFQGDPSLNVEAIAYRKVAGAPTSFSRFPLSLTQPLRSITHVCTNSTHDVIEEAVTKQVTGYGDGRLFVEELSTRPNASFTESLRISTHSRRDFKRAILADAARVLASQNRLLMVEPQPLNTPQLMLEIHRIISHGRDFTRNVANRTGKVLDHRTAYRKRMILTMNRYGLATTRWWHTLKPWGSVDGPDSAPSAHGSNRTPTGGEKP